MATRVPRHSVRMWEEGKKGTEWVEDYRGIENEDGLQTEEQENMNEIFNRNTEQTDYTHSRTKFSLVRMSPPH